MLLLAPALPLLWLSAKTSADQRQSLYGSEVRFKVYNEARTRGLERSHHAAASKTTGAVALLRLTAVALDG